MMSRLFRSFVVAIALCLGAGAGAWAQGLSALARVDGARSETRDHGAGFDLTLGLTQAVPYRVRLWDEPRRVVVDFREVDFTGLSAETMQGADAVAGVTMGRLGAGWSRMVVELTQPVLLVDAIYTGADGSAPVALNLSFTATSAPDFAARAAKPNDGDPIWGRPAVREVEAPILRQDGTRPLRVVLDPGHGGIDPGAQNDGINEADLMLLFARELRDTLRRGGFEVFLTRESDDFVPLETRVAFAHEAQADLFLSLHADALAEGRATGATVYVLSDQASDVAAQKLAERHDRDNLLLGVDLHDHDDVVAGILMDLTRRETEPRTMALAQTLVDHMGRHIGPLYKKPLQQAGFSVLKAPDIPSVLIELGFLSSPGDLDKLQNAEWRARAAQSIADAIADWSQNDAAQGALIRQ